MTAGKYIKTLLEKKEVSITELSKEMGLKSRSTFYRLFDDYYSREKTCELVDEIVKHIELTEEEKRDLDTRFGSDRVSSFFKRTRQILSKCYDSSLEGGYIVNTPKGGSELISEMKKHCEGEVTVFMVNVDDERVIGDISALLEWNGRVKVYNYIKLRSHRIRTAYELLALISLWRFPGYTPVISDFSEYKGLCMLTAYNGRYNYLSVNINKDRDCYVDTPVTKDMYDYMMANNGYFVKTGETLRTSVSKVSDYIDLVENSVELLYKDDMFFSEGAPCFGTLSFDILYDMFKDINYFGFPPDHVYVQRLVTLFKERESFETGPGALERRVLFDAEHVKHMMKTGISFDHLDAFMPMSAAQCRLFFGRLLRCAREQGNYKIRFIKRDRIKAPYVCSGSGVLYLYGRGDDMSDGSSMFLKRSCIRDIMKDFTGYVWDNFTYSDEESIKKLETMINEYLV